MKYSEFNTNKQKCRFLCDLNKRNKSNCKSYTFNESLKFLSIDIKLLSGINSVELFKNDAPNYSSAFFLRFYKFKLDKLTFSQVNIALEILSEIRLKISKLDNIKCDVKNKIIIDDDFIFELIQIQKIHINFTLLKNIISLMKSYKIISKYSQDVKIIKRKNSNSNHIHFLKGDLGYYNQVKIEHETLIESIFEASDSIEKSKQFFVYFELYTIKKYSSTFRKHLNFENLKLLDDQTVVLIFNDNEKVNVNFFEPVLNDLLKGIFFTKSKNLLNHLQYIDFNQSIIDEYIKSKYKNIFSKLKSTGIKGDTTIIKQIKKIIYNNMAMSLQLRLSPLSVTAYMQTTYPKISYAELLIMYPYLCDKKLLELENNNIKKQQTRYTDSDKITDKHIKDYLNNKLKIGDDEEIDFVEYLNQDLEDYYKLRKFKSFIKTASKYKTSNKKKYKNYLTKFLKFLYGSVLGDIIIDIEQDKFIRKNFDNRHLLIKSINSSLLKCTTSLAKNFQSYGETIKFYELFNATAKNNLDIYLDSDDPIESILKKHCRMKNIKEKSMHVPILNKVVLKMAYHIESIIDDSKYSIYSKNNLATNTIYVKFNILFKYCFEPVIKIGELSNNAKIDIKESIEKMGKDNTETANKYKGIINSFLEKYNLSIDIKSEKNQIVNKSLVLYSEFEKLIDSLYIKSNLNYSKSYIPHKNLQQATYYILAFYSGLREIELLTRLRRDLFISDNILFIDVNTKGLKETNTNDGNFKSSSGKRRVQFEIRNEKYLRTIKLYYKIIHEDGAKFLFPSYNKVKNKYFENKIQNASFLSSLNTYLKVQLNNNNLNIKRYITLHSFRHSYATYTFENILNNPNEAALKSDFLDFLVKIGHAEPGVTFKFYIHLDFILFKLLR